MLRKKKTVISWDSRGNRMLTVSALCKEGCNWSREKWRESRKPLWLNRESDWSRYRNDEIWHQFLSTSAAGHKWWRLLADYDVPRQVRDTARYPAGITPSVNGPLQSHRVTVMIDSGTELSFAPPPPSIPGLIRSRTDSQCWLLLLLQSETPKEVRLRRGYAILRTPYLLWGVIDLPLPEEELALPVAE